MRNLFVFLLILFSVNNSFGQSEEVPNFRKSDILIDPFWLIGGLAVNATYERILSEDSGVAANAIFRIGSDLDDFVQISPYYRAYFGAKYESGFYIEGFVPFAVVEIKDWSNGSQTTSSSQNTSAGLGFGLGGKWVATKKSVFALYLATVRQSIGTFSNEDQVTGTGMIGVGFAFYQIQKSPLILNGYF